MLLLKLGMPPEKTNIEASALLRGATKSSAARVVCGAAAGSAFMTIDASASEGGQSNLL